VVRPMAPVRGPSGSCIHMSGDRELPAALIAEAKTKPGGWVYEIVGDYGPDDAVPPTAIRGAWRVLAEPGIRRRRQPLSLVRLVVRPKPVLGYEAVEGPVQAELDVGVLGDNGAAVTADYR
jgi:hypothetical protein